MVKADLAGVNLDTVGLEIVGRELVITGARPVQETEGRVYQQVEIEAGPFRRVVGLNADVVADEAKATYEDGILRVELPLRAGGRASRRVPIELFHHLQTGGPDLDHVAGADQGGPMNGQVVDDRAVQGPQVLDLEALVRRPDGRVPP